MNHSTANLSQIIKICGFAAALIIATATTSYSETDKLKALLEEQKMYVDESSPADFPSEVSELYYHSGLEFTYPAEGVAATLNLLLQEKYNFSDYDGYKLGGNRSSFSTHEARLYLSGSALYDEFRYRLEANLHPTNSENQPDSTSLEEAFIAWGPCTCSFLKVGQFQTSYVRQEQSPDEALQFVNKSIAAEIFDRGPQNGAYAQYNFSPNVLEGSLSIYNGDSENEGINRSGLDTKHLGLAAVRWSPLGVIDPFMEGDMSWSEDLALSLGASYGFEEYQSELLGVSNNHSHLTNGDLTLKYRGASLTSEIMIEHQNAESAGFNPIGFYVQAGYFVVPRKFEAALRYSQTNCDGSPRGSCLGVDNYRQTTVGINYFLWEYKLKLMLNYDHLAQTESVSDSLRSDVVSAMASFYL